MLADPEEQSPPRSFSSDRSSDEGLRFCGLRGVRWRMNLGLLPSSPTSSIEALRRIAADSRRSYANLRRQLLIDPHILKDGNKSPDLAMDNPLSQNPESTWGRFFHYAEIEKMVDQDLTRLYPEEGSFFQTSACQAMLRRILQLWCLRHPKYGYSQGMHELLAPLVYVLHADADYLSKVRGLCVEYFTDEFDELTYPDRDQYSCKTIKKAKSWDFGGKDNLSERNVHKIANLDDLDPETRDICLLSDAYGAEGELGVVISERFMEHDAYTMFDSLMNGTHGVVSMVDFFFISPSMGFNTGIPPIIEASSAVYHLLAVVDSSLHSHLIELGVEPQYFALRWLRVLFEREFSLDDLLVIWDELFSYSNDSMMKNDEYQFKILCSARGAFLSAMAVSMLLHVKSSLLATENATSCLQKLLNFPRSINMVKLIEKARSFQVLAWEANILSLSQHSSTKYRPLAPVITCSVSPRTPIVVDSYWEEQWRVLQKEEAVLNSNSSKGRKIKNLLGQRLGLSRTESVPVPPKNLPSKKPAVHSVCRRLFNDFPQCHGPPLNADMRKHLSDENLSRTSDFLDVKTCAGAENSSTSSTESSITTDLTREINYAEIESENNSLTSNSLIDENEDDSNNVQEKKHDSRLETFAAFTVFETNDNAEVALTPGSNERKTLAGRFHWLWKLGKTNSSEQSLKNEINAERQTSSSLVNGNLCQETSSNHRNCCSDSGRIEVGDMKMMCTLKNLGQSMLENIQAIESVFQQEKGSAGNARSGKGQAKAFAALKELRKVSNLLSEM